MRSTVAIRHLIVVLGVKGFLKKVKAKEFYWITMQLWASMGQTTSLPLEMPLLLHPMTWNQKMGTSLCMLEKDTMKNMSLFQNTRRTSCSLEMVSTTLSSQGIIVSLMVGQLSIPPPSVCTFFLSFFFLLVILFLSKYYIYKLVLERYTFLLLIP